MADAAFLRRAFDACGWDHAQNLAPFAAAHELYDKIWRSYAGA